MARSGKAIKAQEEQESALYLNMQNKSVISQKHPITQIWKRKETWNIFLKFKKKSNHN